MVLWKKKTRKRVRNTYARWRRPRWAIGKLRKDAVPPLSTPPSEWDLTKQSQQIILSRVIFFLPTFVWCAITRAQNAQLPFYQLNTLVVSCYLLRGLCACAFARVIVGGHMRVCNLIPRVSRRHSATVTISCTLSFRRFADTSRRDGSGCAKVLCARLVLMCAKLHFSYRGLECL